MKKWSSYTWVDQSITHRYAFAILIAALSVGCQWLIYPLVQARLPFLFILPSIILATALAGRGAGLLVVTAGLLNAVALQAATLAAWKFTPEDAVALTAYAFTATLLVVVGGHFRATARQELADITALHERFRSVLESSVVPFTILSPVRDASRAIVDFRWTYVNAAAARVLGHSPQQLLGERVDALLPGSSEAPGVLKTCISVIESQQARHFELESRAHGLTGWFQVIASPIEDSVAVWFMDVSERKQQEHRLRDADRRKDEFLATLAHELRNPLAPIRQAALIARSDAASDAQKRWSYSIIERQVQHMSLLLDDLLDVSRITRGTLQLRKQRTDLQSVVGAAVETARVLIDSRHHQFFLDVPGDLLVEGDPLRLAQVVSNLLTNAAKYTEPGGTIRCTAANQDEHVVIVVQDSGIGISPQDLPKIFRMFAQAGSTQEHAQGLGIGLALAKGLVELHGGRIEARSPGLGQGSTFTVLLPKPLPVAQPATVSRETRAPRLKISKRILIADDNPDAAESMAVLLRLEGHSVHVSHDGSSAIDAFMQQPFDVALIDLEMPHVDGYQVARRIRASQGSNALLIALTGRGQESDRARAAEAGFDHHLVKPVLSETLFELLAPSGGVAVAS